MGKTKELSLEVRAAIVAGYSAGMPIKELARMYNCHRNSIAYQIQKSETKSSLKNVQGRGRKRATSAKEDQRIVKLLKRNPQEKIKQVQNEINYNRKVKICPMTVRRRLYEANVKAYTIQKKPFISQTNRRKRLKFAHTYQSKPVEFWRNILWTDESCFSLDGTYGRKYFYSTPEQKKNRTVIMPTRHSGGGKIMVWGCFSYNGVGKLIMLPEKVTSSTYLEVLNEYALVSGCELIGQHFILQQDNAPIHKSKFITKFLRDLDQQTLDWPPQSPDLNPIENMWNYLKQKMAVEVGRQPNETFAVVKNIWDQIPTQMLENLVNSIPQRLHEVIANNGGNTSY